MSMDLSGNLKAHVAALESFLRRLVRERLRRLSRERSVLVRADEVFSTRAVSGRTGNLPPL
jgi:hypothetical protein